MTKYSLDWFYKLSTFHFFGGPWHGETREIPGDLEYLFIYVPELNWVSWEESPSEYVQIKRAVYRKAHETYIVWPKGWAVQDRKCYVFAGIE